MTLQLVDLPTRREIPRDGWDRPLIVPKTGGKPVAHTRTTTFIDCVEDKSNLIDWGKRMVLYGAAQKPSLLDAVVDLDPKDKGDKRKLTALAEAALDASGANDKREKGTYLHALSELVDAGQPLPEGLDMVDLMDMAAYRMTTMDLVMERVEQFVVVPELKVGGTFDRSLRYTGPGPLPGMHFENELLIGDLKTGSIEYGFLKMSAQLAAYSRGERYDHTIFPEVDTSDKKAFAAWKKTEFEPELASSAYSSLGDVNQEWGVIISLPSGSNQCELLWANLTVGWELAKLALTIRDARKTKGALIPFSENLLSTDVASVA